MDQSHKGLLGFLTKLMAVLGLFTTLIGVVSQFYAMTANPQQLRIISIAGYVVLLASICWLFFVADEGRRFFLVGFHIVTILFFTWVGTWFADQFQFGPIGFPGWPGVSIAAYLILLYGEYWAMNTGFRISRTWRTAMVALCYIVTIIYSVWLGTWIQM
jgi:hypothetical protein